MFSVSLEVSQSSVKHVHVLHISIWWWEQHRQRNKELQDLVRAGLGFSLPGKMIMVLGSVPEPSISEHW